jgi:hypothetical protein
MFNNRYSVPTPPQNVNLLAINNRAKERQQLRQNFLDLLFPLIPNPFTGGGTTDDQRNQILNDLASSFSRYAVYQQTVYDNGASRSVNSSDASLMARQIEQAFNKVLGRSYGNSPDGFVNALNSAFPSTKTVDGSIVSSTPQRSLVWLSNPNGNLTTSKGGYAGQLPARQATLYRQTSIMAADALQVVRGIQSFVPEANPEQVEALRAQIVAEINALVDEFGRVDEPRLERVSAYLNTLTFHVTEFGRRAFLDNFNLVTTDEDEAQTASFALLQSYTNTIREIAIAFFKTDRSDLTFFSLSERVERATIVLPIISQANVDFEAAMDSVDFPESDRRSVATKFTELADFTFTIKVGDDAVDISLEQPDITVYDLTEWFGRFANSEGPSSLADSGQYGLDFVTDQADTLFWVIAPIVGHFRTTATGTSTPTSAGSTTLEQVLSNERVIWSLNNLLTQLNALANLGVPGEKKNPVRRPK